jgi:PAS domain S-box-containing protein
MDEQIEDKIRVVIVDDNIELCNKYKSSLEERSDRHLISVAYSGSEALAALKEQETDVLLTDIRMPGINGIDLMKQAKEIQNDLQTIVLTGHGDMNSVIEALRLGAFNFFQKPVALDILHFSIINAYRKKQSEKALRESEQRYRTLFDNANDGIYIYEVGKPFLDVNEAVCKKLGYSSEELLKMTVWDITPPEYHGSIHDRIAELRENGHAVFETVRKTKSGETVYVEGSSRVIRYAGKSVIMTISRDISERKKAEAEREKLQTQLRQAQKMESIGTLAGGIAHDFNNILFPIIGFTEMVIGEMPTASRNRGYLEEVLKASYRAKELVKQILAFSRQSELERKPLKIQYIIKEATHLLRASLPTTIQIHSNIDPKCAPILGDPSQIHQILMNMGTNAYHAMPNGGTLELSLTEVSLRRNEVSSYAGMEPGKYLKFTISDTGQGMTPDVKERIFEPYFTTKEKSKGTGLGLSVVHGIVRSCGGYIRVYSEPGSGTSFHIYFPVVSDMIHEAISVPETTVSGGNERILLVDDEMQISAMLHQMLEQLGYQVRTRTSSVEALELFRNQPDMFDLLITDVTMPNITGIELSKKILQIRPDLPIILCTGFSEMITKEKAKDIGIREFIMKPVLRSEIAAAIRRVLGDRK